MMKVLGWKLGRCLALGGAAILMALALPGAASAAWFRAESPHFIVYGGGDERYAREYAAKLETFDEVLRGFHGMPAGEAAARKLEVYLVEGAGQLRQIRPDADYRVGGFYSTSAEKVFAVVRRDVDGDHILFHEYVHHFMYQYFPYGYPAWLVEGYPEYFASTRVGDRYVEVGIPGPGRMATLLTLGRMPVGELLTAAPSALKGNQVSIFYAQSWLLTHYMLSDPQRKTQFDAYLRAVGSGARSTDAMVQATGLDLETLGARLIGYTKLAYARLPRTRSDAAITVTRLSPAADDLLLDGLRLGGSTPKADRAAFVEQVRADAAKHPGDRLAGLTLARTEIKLGDRAKAEPVLKALLAADPDDADALELMGSSLLDAGEDTTDRARKQALFREARPYLIRASRKDPTRYQTLYAYARSRTVEDAYPNANDLNALIEARALAPQVPEITIRTAEALVRHGRSPEAIALLTPVANDPHRTGPAAVAKAMLARLNAASKPAAPAPAPSAPR